MQNEEGGGAALGGEMPFNATLGYSVAGLDQDLESMASDKAQWRDMLALLVS